MLRVEKPLTDLSLVQGTQKAQEQGLPLGKQAPATQDAQLFQSELMNVLAGQQETKQPPELIAMLEGKEADQMQKLLGEEALSSEVKNSDELIKAVTGNTNEKILPIINQEPQVIDQNIQATNKELSNEINTGIKELEQLLSDNSGKVEVKVVEAKNENAILNKASAQKMKSPWSINNILGEDSVSSKEDLAIQNYGNKEAKKNADETIHKDMNKLDKKFIAEVGNSNNKIKQTNSMKEFHAFKQNNPFKSAIMSDTIDLKKAGPTVFEGEKFENINDIHKNNLMSIGGMTAGQKLSQNMTFKEADGIESSSKVNDISQKIMDYIRQNAKMDNGNVEVQFNHETLGDIVLKVNEAEKGIVNVNLQSIQKQGVDFFNKNKGEIVEILSKSGLKVADFNVTQSNTENNNGSNLFNGNSQNQQSSQKQHQQQQDSQRRKEMWQQYQEQEAA